MMKRQNTILIFLLTGILLTAGCSKDENVDSITLNKTELILEAGETETLIATIYTENGTNNGTNNSVTWTSSNSTVATVNNNGLISAIKKGNALITATTNNGNKQATCSVNVQDYRDKWVGKYRCVCVRQIIYRYSTVIDVSLYADSMVYIKEIPRPSGAYLNNPAKINGDGSFFFIDFDDSGNFYQDSIAIAPDESVSYYGTKIKNN